MTDPWRGLLDALLDIERAKRASYQIDGQIIGTGEADFTKGNTLYVLKHQERMFQLMDVPGIEGNETRYTDLVQEAIAKAHLVVYVNGTNKKPESATVEKIRSYLRRGTLVCPIINVRGLADAYEFEEDRAALSDHQNSSEALKQTQSSLSAALGEEILLPGYCVQGLMAFSALAISPHSRKSSIHSSREKDLGAYQQKFIKCFGTPAALRDFSKIDEVAGVLQSKLSTFKEDIVESNKTKVRELLRTTIFDLERMRDSNSAFLKEIEVEFQNCQRSMEDAMKRFTDHVNRNSLIIYDTLFNELKEKVDEIIRDNFGENKEIENKIKKDIHDIRLKARSKQNSMSKEALSKFEADTKQTTKRFFENVHRIDFQQRVHLGNISWETFNKSVNTELSFWSEAEGFFKNATQYVLSLISLGKIGAIVGIILGAIKTIVGIFMTKESRIRSAQKKYKDDIDKAQKESIVEINKELKKYFAFIELKIEIPIIEELEILQDNMKKPQIVLEQQIKTMRHTLATLESMPHGTIRAV